MVLTDPVQLRFEAISFFLAIFVIAIGIVRLAWNSIHAEFPRLPKLSRRQAWGLGTTAGLLAFAVLVIIAGAGQSLAPGAWRSPVEQEESADLVWDVGAIEDPVIPQGDDEPARRVQLERLGMELVRFAVRHGDQFPSSAAASGFDASVWRTTDPAGMRSLYVPGGHRGERDRVVAFEPGIFHGERLALFGNASIRRLPLDAILKTTPPGGSQ